MSTAAGTTRRVLLTCAASVAVIVAFLATLAPGVTSAASRDSAQRGNPIVVTLTPATDALGGPALIPGEAAYRPVSVANDGSAPFSYHLRLRATGGLADAVTVELRLVSGPCAADTFAQSTVVAAGPGSLADFPPGVERVLEPGQVENLCGRVLLAAAAGADRAGQAADAVLEAVASQL